MMASTRTSFTKSRVPWSSQANAPGLWGKAGHPAVSTALHRDTEMAGEFSPMALQPHPAVAPFSFHPMVLLESVSFLGVMFLSRIV